MIDIPSNFYRVSIKALILDVKKRFMLLYEDNGKWELPGGGLDYKEKPKENLIREIKEETGLEVTSIKKQPSYFITAQHEKGYWIANIIFEVTVNGLKFVPSDECRDLKFFSVEDALKVPLHNTGKVFIKVYNPDNH